MHFRHQWMSIITINFALWTLHKTIAHSNLFFGCCKWLLTNNASNEFCLKCGLKSFLFFLTKLNIHSQEALKCEVLRILSIILANHGYFFDKRLHWTLILLFMIKSDSKSTWYCKNSFFSRSNSCALVLLLGMQSIASEYLSTTKNHSAKILLLSHIYMCICMQQKFNIFLKVTF